MRQKAHGYWVCEIFLSRPVSLTARIENKNRRSGHCHEMQGRAKPLSLHEWTRTLLSPAIRRSPMSAAVVKCGEPVAQLRHSSMLFVLRGQLPLWP
jgi:hypothetical protein